MTTSTGRIESAEFNDRVRIFIQVILGLDLFAYLSDAVTPLVVENLVVREMPSEVVAVRAAQTVVLFSAWAWVRFRPPPHRVGVLLESGLTLWILFVYTFVGSRYEPPDVPWFGAVFSMFGVLLLLTLRAALVPSTLLRTLGLGVVALGIYAWVAREGLERLQPAALEGLIFLGGAFDVIIAIISHTIYGLRAEVRDARQMGQYLLEKRLGKGGMGEVYLARHRLLRRSTAVKLLPAEFTSESAVARFQSEVQLTSELTHPNTIRIFDYGRTEEGVFYYAMEHLKGATLAEIVELDGPQPAGRVLKLLCEASGALEEAHEAGLIHRDIKPANLMLSRQGLDPDALKVLDFGLVYKTDGTGSGGVTQEGTIVGTPLYMAPEVIKQADAASPASDLYALAAVGYYLATGTHVFSGESIIETCSHHLHTEPETMSQRLGENLPADFEEIIMKSLRKEPSERYTSASDFQRAVRKCRDFGTWSLEDATAWWKRRGDELQEPNTTESSSPRALTIAASES